MKTRSTVIYTFQLTGLVALLLGAGVAWTLHDAQQSIEAWGSGFIDQPLVIEEAHPVLDPGMRFHLDRIEVSRPASISAPLNAQLDWWLPNSDMRIWLGPAQEDGARLFHLKYKIPKCCEYSTPLWALPVTCPAPSSARLCYHTGLRLQRGRHVVEIHAALTLEETESAEEDAPEVVLHCDFLQLMPGSTPLTFLDGPLRSLGRTSFGELMEIYDAERELGRILTAPTELVDLGEPGWAVSAHATATVDREHAGPLRCRFRGRNFCERPERSFVDLWREHVGLSTVEEADD